MPVSSEFRIRLRCRRPLVRVCCFCGAVVFVVWLKGLQVARKANRRSRKGVDDKNNFRQGLAYARVVGISHPAEMPEAFGGECSHAAGCLTGPGAFPRRRGNDTLILSAASSGQGHVRADGGLPTPCRWGDSLHVSRSVSTVRAGGKVNDRKHRAVSCLIQTTVHLVRSGTCHRSMVQVRGLAGWLAARRLLHAVCCCAVGFYRARAGFCNVRRSQNHCSARDGYRWRKSSSRAWGWKAGA